MNTTLARMLASAATLVQEAADTARDTRQSMDADPDAPIYVQLGQLARRLKEDAAELAAVAEAYDEHRASA